MDFIKSENICFKYSNLSQEKNVVDNLSLSIKQGELIAILGHNGSGKSTFAKMLNAILIPTSGNLFIKGINSKTEKNLWDIRKNVGLIFQNPDNQIVATTVEDDVAFGLENIQIDPKEMNYRVEEALNFVDMFESRKLNPENLSGGQKQRISIASVLAMQPKCIVFDEATSMLDPYGRKQVISLIKKINKEQKTTIIFITHNMEEAILFNRIIIMKNGKIELDGDNKKIFKQVEKLKMLNIEPPSQIDFLYNLNKKGFNVNFEYLNLEDVQNQILKLSPKKNYGFKIDENKTTQQEEVLTLKNVCYTYMQNTAFEKKALENIDLTFYKGEFVGIIGKTGSGKSTLVKTLNGLIKPTKGDVFLKTESIFTNNQTLKNARQKIGIVFQYPEDQLFEETVFKDVAFALKNKGFNEQDINKKVTEVLDIVGIDQSLFYKSPFELSGGQKRRVAIAGVLAMQPEVLILDEPTVGLDPFWRKKILKNIQNINKSLNISIILISHYMEEIAEFASRVVVLNDGQVKIDDTIEKVFSKHNILQKFGLDVPKINQIIFNLNKKGMNIPQNIYTVSKAIEYFENAFEK